MFNKLKIRFFKTRMIRSTVFLTVMHLVLMWYFKQETGEDFTFALYNEMYNSFMSFIPEGFSEANVLVYKEAVELIVGNFIHLMPSLIIIVSMCVSYLSYASARLFARDKSVYVKFSELKASNFIAVGYALFFVISLLLPVSDLAHSVMNVHYIFSFLLLVCGIAFYMRKMQEKNMSKPLRALAGSGLFVSLCIPLASYFYIITGLFDAFKNSHPSKDDDNGGI